MNKETKNRTAQDEEHIRQMKLKYLHMMLSGRSMLADAGLAPVFGPQPTQTKDKKEPKNDK